MNRAAVLYAVISAALFGVSTPAAKVLVGAIHPAVLAGLLYCGAGVGVAVLRRIRPPASMSRVAPEAALARSDVPAASLLLTLEGAATALMAWFVFHENFDRRIALGMLCLVLGAAVLSWSGTPTLDNVLGPLAIVGA